MVIALLIFFVFYVLFFAVLLNWYASDTYEGIRQASDEQILTDLKKDVQ